jgi:hypothetical protein
MSRMFDFSCCNYLKSSADDEAPLVNNGAKLEN